MLMVASHPIIKNNTITLGAEQLAVVGFNKYADEKYDFGRDETIQYSAEHCKAQCTIFFNKK